jgi:hypothetical protein
MDVCSRCGANFECGLVAGKEPCWCAALPSLPVNAYRPDPDDPATSRCLCPYCLRALLAAQDTIAVPPAA